MSREVTLALAFTAVAVTVTAAPSHAATLRCESRGFCTNDLTCREAGDILIVNDLPGGKVRFGWEGAEARFVGTPLRREGFTLYVADGLNSAVQILVVADDGNATMGVATVLLDDLYHSMQVLTCHRADR